MNIDKMRKAIKQTYPNKNWAIRVDEMHDQQVTAIFLRFKREGKLQGLRVQQAVHKACQMVYLCNGCGLTYIRDNPDLEECEYCGSLQIQRGGYTDGE